MTLCFMPRVSKRQVVWAFWSHLFVDSPEADREELIEFEWSFSLEWVAWAVKSVFRVRHSSSKVTKRHNYASLMQFPEGKIV